MKVLALVLLCTKLYVSWAKSLLQPADCGDPRVHQAVDAAIKKYNEELKDGHQFALYRITKAKTQLEKETHYFVTYEIRESTCSVHDNKIWQECNYVSPISATTGTCIAEVYIDETVKTSEVVSQKCDLVPPKDPIVPSVAQCLGCPREIPTNSSKVKVVLDAALKKYNKESNHSFHFGVVEIKRATSQVVAGFKYRVEFRITETNCSKKDFEELTEDCAISEKNPHNCNSATTVVPWKNTTTTDVNCVLEMALLRLPAGMSPFRVLQATPDSAKEEKETELRRTDDKPHGHERGRGRGRGQEHGRGPGHEHGHGHKEKKIHGHKQHGDDSSEEHHSHEETTVATTISESLPDNADKPIPGSGLLPSSVLIKPPSSGPGPVVLPSHPEQIPAPDKPVTSTVEFPSFPDVALVSASLPDLHKETFPDLPEGPEIKCPGQPWKPISPLHGVTSEFSHTSSAYEEKSMVGGATDFKDTDLLGF
ncbi:kininogen-1 [Latimeria chalumnae]|nr:PREDICTED: kininogen-1 [Latimeria chalumnae]|eukprot:XP_005989461.1 PREDICTED: kininogen-1 [Latimeria chalumnae]